MWPGGASAVSVAAELLAGPMWGGREGGPGCPSGQPGKRPTRSRLRRNAITQQTACWTTQHATAFFFQPRRSARRSPGSASGLGRVARVRADVREQCRINSATESSGTVTDTASVRPCESVPSVCGWTVQAETLGFLCLLCVKVWCNRGWRIFLDFSLQTGCRLLRYNSCRSTGKHACSLPEWYHYRQTGWRLFLDFHLLLFGLGRTYKLRVENKDIDRRAVRRYIWC